MKLTKAFDSRRSARSLSLTMLRATPMQYFHASGTGAPSAILLTATVTVASAASAGSEMPFMVKNPSSFL